MMGNEKFRKFLGNVGRAVRDTKNDAWDKLNPFEAEKCRNQAYLSTAEKEEADRHQQAVQLAKEGERDWLNNMTADERQQLVNKRWNHAAKLAMKVTTDENGIITEINGLNE